MMIFIFTERFVAPMKAKKVEANKLKQVHKPWVLKLLVGKE